MFRGIFFIFCCLNDGQTIYLACAEIVLKVFALNQLLIQGIFYEVEK